MPYEEEEEEQPVVYVPVDPADYPSNANPHALGWFEYTADDRPGAPAGYFLTQDTTVDASKTYYIEEGADIMSEALAYSTYQTYFMYRTSSGGTYTKVLDIKDYPDMLGDPNMLECTTLSDSQEKQIPGILRLGDGFQFTANYTPTNFSTIKTLEGHQYEYALWLGGTSAGVPDGHNGKFSWTGDVRAGFPGKGVDEVQDMTITATPSTDVQWSAGT